MLDVIGELAANSAIGAHAVDFEVRELRAHVGGIDEARRHQRAGRAGLHSFAAGDAGRFPHRVVEIECRSRGHADHMRRRFLTAATSQRVLPGPLERRKSLCAARSRCCWTRPSDRMVFPVVWVII